MLQLVTPACHEESRLRRTLAEVRRQVALGALGTEAGIVVDTTSTDATAVVARAASAPVLLPTDVVPADRPASHPER